MSYNFTEEIIEDKSDYNIDQLGLQVIAKFLTYF